MPPFFSSGLRLLLSYGRVALPVVIAAGLTGCAGYQSLTEQSMNATPSTSEKAERGDVADLLNKVFRRYQGTPYKYGGTDAQGFDCSGFIRAAYKEGLDQQLPRTTGQMLAEGHFVRRDQLKPGDLIFFRINGKEQHAGIFIGNGRFIHSASSKGVTESSLTSPYWRQRYTQARRFL